MHVPHEIMFTFVLNLQRIYAPSRLKPPFARNVKFVYLFWKSLEIRINTNEWQLNCAEYGLQIWLTPTKARRVWNLTYSRSETNNALKISLEVMKLVYLHTTYVLSVLIIVLIITCTKFWILWIALALHPICTLSLIQTWLALNDEIRV